MRYMEETVIAETVCYLEAEIRSEEGPERGYISLIVIFDFKDIVYVF